MAWFLLILLCLGKSRAQFLDATNTSDSNLEERLLSLLQRFQKEESYDTLLIYGKDCAFPSLARRLQVPTVLATLGKTNFDWNFSSSTFILSCGLGDEKEDNYRTLMKLQRNRRLILLREDKQPDSVCEYYSKKEQYNIAIVKENFDQLDVIYSCRLFEDQKYEKLNFSENKPIFVKQFQNMQGAPIKTITDNLAPQTMTYWDSKSGKQKYIGFVANSLLHFIKKVNATMIMHAESIDVGQETSFINISEWATNDQVDIGMCQAAYYDKTNFDTVSYPYLMSSNCFMVPLPDRMPFSQVYMAIVELPVLIVICVLFCIFSVMLIYFKEKSLRGLGLISVLMNDICFRGFLAQSFPFPRYSNRKVKLILMLLCFSSLITTTMYTAYLQTFLWSPPVDPFMTAFADLAKSRYKVAIPLYAVETLRTTNVSMDHVLIFEDLYEFLRLRATFNDNYIYLVTELRWLTFEEQQKLFAYPLFYYSETLCLHYLEYFNFPIRRFLPYRDLFEENLLRQKDSGLASYWLDSSFMHMLRLNLTKADDLSPPHLEDYIEVHNLSWVFGMYFAGLGLSLCCFILELMRIPNCWRRLRIFKC
ncbi:uncharacterized protein LOC108112081 [Drosophila eugracilis]|uniref:uncharacterized protein LOC108112081 n=1 Tax=Drosophila eugracilis TaxID=29029 RepID=UPI0007E7F184|nr:uncharacterized protein LOC108112081 [Drosophila eugracilis]